MIVLRLSLVLLNDEGALPFLKVAQHSVKCFAVQYVRVLLKKTESVIY